MEIIENILFHIGSFAIFMIGMTVVCLIMIVAGHSGENE
jgi:hypothetical protein